MVVQAVFKLFMLGIVTLTCGKEIQVLLMLRPKQLRRNCAIALNRKSLTSYSFVDVLVVMTYKMRVHDAFIIVPFINISISYVYHQCLLKAKVGLLSMSGSNRCLGCWSRLLASILNASSFKDTKFSSCIHCVV